MTIRRLPPTAYLWRQYFDPSGITIRVSPCPAVIVYLAAFGLAFLIASSVNLVDMVAPGSIFAG